MHGIFFQNPLFDDSQIGIIVIDTQKNIVDINKFLSVSTGYNKTFMIEKCIDNFLKQISLTHICPINHSIEKNKVSMLNNYILIDSTGTNNYVKILSIPITNDSKTVQGCYIMIVPEVQTCSKLFTSSNCTMDFSQLGLICESGIMHELCYLIKTVAPTDATVLITGETGTGKEIVANIIHKLSTRSENDYIIVNCPTLSDNLLNNELFGHEKGSYTGAIEKYRGIFETARNGTVFLDEIGEIGPIFQAKLLRILESGEFQRIGSVVAKKTNARIIAATNKNLKKMVDEGNFREDLYYRLNVFPVHIPPLRDRITDLPLLIDYFINNLNQKYNKNTLGVSDVALTLLFGYSFPGNIRELKNIIEHAHIKCKSETIQASDFPKYFLEKVDAIKITKSSQKSEDNIIHLLKIFNGNKTKVAKSLGISRKTLYNKLKKMNIK